jgi:hypothetical protein
MTPLKFALPLVLVVILSIGQWKRPDNGPASKTVQVPISTCRPIRLRAKPDPLAGTGGCHGDRYGFIDSCVIWLRSTRAVNDSGVAASGGGFTFGT